MKRIYLALAAVLAFSAATYAQKDVDLKLVIKSPTSATDYANQNFGDSIRFSFQITNEGTEAVTITDTMKLWLTTRIFGDEVYNIQGAVRMGMPPTAMAPGDTSPVYGLWIKQGDNFYTSGPNEVAFPVDAKGCFSMYVYGYSDDGYYFMDPDFSGATYNNASSIGDYLSAMSGNNADTQIAVKFGTGAGAADCGSYPLDIISVKPNTFNINVYPNPVENQLGFSYEFNKASNATVRILDVVGRVVMTKDFGKVNMGVQNFNLNVSNLNTGVYMIEFNSENGRGVTKFTKK